MNPSEQVRQPSARPSWHRFFSDALRLVLVPLILCSSGFFTANFLLSGRYTWPQTSRVFVLSLTILVLTYEFVYKEQLARSVTREAALRTVLYSCVIPYGVGLILMVLLAKL